MTAMNNRNDPDEVESKKEQTQMTLNVFSDLIEQVMAKTI